MKEPQMSGLSRRELGVDPWMDDPRRARGINAFAVEFAVRYMVEASALFGHDYDCAMIFLGVLEANGRQNIRTSLFREVYADVRVAIPPELARPMSRQAIALALGMARETVRRKIDKLIKLGFLVEAPGGGVITSREVITRPDFLAAQERAVDYVRRFRSDLIEYVSTPM